MFSHAKLHWAFSYTYLDKEPGPQEISNFEAQAMIIALVLGRQWLRCHLLFATCDIKEGWWCFPYSYFQIPASNERATDSLCEGQRYCPIPSVCLTLLCCLSLNKSAPSRKIRIRQAETGSSSLPADTHSQLHRALQSGSWLWLEPFLPHWVLG